MNNSIAVIVNKVSLLDIRSDESRYPRLKTYRRDDAIREMTKIVYAVLLYQGRTLSSEDIKVHASNAVDVILSDPAGVGSPEITFEEISRALIKRASIEDFWISGATINQTITQYCKTDGNKARIDAINQRRQIAQPGPKTTISALLEEFSKEMVNNNKINRR